VCRDGGVLLVFGGLGFDLLMPTSNHGQYTGREVFAHRMQCRQPDGTDCTPRAPHLPPVITNYTDTKKSFLCLDKTCGIAAHLTEHFSHYM